MDKQLNEGGSLLPSEKVARYSMISACFNFVNSIIGSGVIGLPYAFNQAGLPLGFLLLILVAFITDYTIILLIRGGHLSRANSYQRLVQSAFGVPGLVLLSALQFLYPFIAMISYNITTADTLTKVFQRIPGVGPEHILANRRFVIIVSTLMCTLPLSLYRNIHKLGKASFLSMLLTLIILLIVIVRAATLGPQIPPTQDAWMFAKWNAIQAVGVMSSAFICHHNSFLIYGSLEPPTLANWTRVTHISVGSSLVISATFALGGYATFTGYTQGDMQRCLWSGAVSGGARMRDCGHRCSLHGRIVGLRLSGNCSGSEWSCERHTSDLHHPLRVLPQAVLRSLVSQRNVDSHHFHPFGRVCHGHWLDLDGS
ncbi:putative sodium-coupled neutral amino acid transporter 11 isoform X2 [Dunckerocampus dactyliophorus]|uniref:putative sodium-coupled neutral amino acid transporter 11 isoform X2 n=1 Tax=Dunckerocampus dactyliophorus TaxID=161453 RepID=UPI002405837A|nr:putative sodium-coupled neutral amino acid transporter 11 isoform X2 [Dunckerocampus dactyliophorus]